MNKPGAKDMMPGYSALEKDCREAAIKREYQKITEACKKALIGYFKLIENTISKETEELNALRLE